MSEPKAISVRCFCFECEAEDGRNNPTETASKSGSRIVDHEGRKDNTPAARKYSGALERLLFGA
jgi:hypothetical protein